MRVTMRLQRLPVGLLVACFFRSGLRSYNVGASSGVPQGFFQGLVSGSSKRSTRNATRRGSKEVAERALRTCGPKNLPL